MARPAAVPVLSHFLVRSRSALGRTVGTLYAINSFGAVLGAASAGFLLLPELGKAHTNWVAVGCNITLGLLAIAFGLRKGFGAPLAEPMEPQMNTDEHGCEKRSGAISVNPCSSVVPNAVVPNDPVSPAAVKLAILTFGVTGFAAMATQIGWTRAISLATGSSTYAFSLIVAVFILGLSLGGMWGARIAPRTPDPLELLARVLLLIGLLNLIVVVLLGYSPFLFFLLIVWGTTQSWNVLLAAEACGIALLIICPTILMGATLPLTLQVASRSGAGAGQTVGTVYAVNTLGAILGSFFGGLVILPALQIQITLELMALLYAIPGLLLFAQSRAWRERKR
ncbi:MAG: fused MFS/spermidine synthase, partial [Planctomycetota bacterium]|nr:fused MFS/spermidine synthase [Planctomycetota bacterium]